MLNKSFFEFSAAFLAIVFGGLVFLVAASLYFKNGDAAWAKIPAALAEVIFGLF